MLRKETKVAQDDMSNSRNIIGKDTIIKGDIESFGNIRVEGKVYGNITTKAKLVLGDSSFVEGNILAQNAEIDGQINGKIEISEVLILKPKANISGDIITNKLTIENGANFNGTSKMGATIKEINLASDKTKKIQEEKTA